MDFNDYIQDWIDEDSPEGDFAQDWNRDRNKPTIDTWKDLKTYLALKACPEAIEIAKDLFHKWKAGC